ncbi:MAG: single-stranded DNA-binding protein [Treponema sp.]|nr:single-stranded DNA-binding protein [Treponema sp.]
MASDKNQVTIEGNMVLEPVLKTTRNGVNICNFCIASNRYFKKNDVFEKEASFFDVQCWADLALDVAQNGRKGKPVCITGRLKQDKWLDQATGQNRSKILIVADQVQFLDRSRPENRGNETSVAHAPNSDDSGWCPF